MKSTKMMIAAAAMTGLLAGTAARSMAATVAVPVPAHSQSSMSRHLAADSAAGVKAQNLADDTTKGKHDCKGKNDCKGQGGCASSDNGCSGKNSCKGKGGCSTNKKTDKTDKTDKTEKTDKTDTAK
ncbi:MAG: hypothetical protein JWN24_3675 [Phycisphaerales bacterium]|nr:hypothetical protein [Phycisphaerales bacterium]